MRSATYLLLILFSSVGFLSAEAHGQSAAASMVRLLKSGRIPAERQGNVIGLIASRGDAADLEYLFEQSIAAEEAENAFNAENRVIALEALAEAAHARKVVPEGDLSQLAKLFEADPVTQLAAVKLAGVWKVTAVADRLQALLALDSTREQLKTAAINALVALGPEHARGAIEHMMAPGQPLEMQYRGIAALAGLDLEKAAKHAAAALKQADEEHRSAAMIEAFLGVQNGPASLGAAIEANPPSVDNAKLALRAIYGVGRSDPLLVDVLNEIAGIEQGPVKLSDEQLKALVEEVLAHGDAARGEAIFRRNDLNCMKCHALSKAGGVIGPDLSPLGKTSPPDYVIRSLLDPDESIKEEFPTLAVQTASGKTYFGILADENDDQIVLRDANGEEIIVPVDDIVAEKKGASLMPKGLTGFVTHQEFLDLVRFVSELGKPGPYEIRDTLSLQRWRLLRQAGAPLREGIPDASVFAEELQAAATDAWTAFYATVAGFVPLHEIEAYAAGEPIFLYGEIEVIEAGKVTFEIEHAEGVRVWVADRDFGAAERVSVGLPEGRHRITLRVDPKPREVDSLRVNFVKSKESPAEYTVVGGA